MTTKYLKSDWQHMYSYINIVVVDGPVDTAAVWSSCPYPEVVVTTAEKWARIPLLLAPNGGVLTDTSANDRSCQNSSTKKKNNLEHKNRPRYPLGGNSHPRLTTCLKKLWNLQSFQTVLVIKKIIIIKIKYIKK